MATELLGTMLGGYNVQPLIELLDDAELGAVAAKGLSHTLLMFDAFHDVKEKADKGNANAKAVMQSWADGEWFTSRPEVPDVAHRDRVQGDRRDQHRRPLAGARRLVAPGHPAARAGHAEEPARRHRRRSRRTRPDQAARRLKAKGYRSPTSATWSAPVRRASRPPTRCCGSSATTSRIVPNKRAGGVCIGGKIAPIFFNTMEDSGALPIECDVSAA